MNPVLKEVIDKIQEDYDFVGTGKDNKTQEKFTYVKYSTVVQLMPSWVDSVRLTFSEYKVSNVYNNYYSIGFNRQQHKR